MSPAPVRPPVVETGVAFDYAAGEIHVDTMVKALVGELRSKDFRLVPDRQCFPYVRLVGKLDQVQFLSPGGQS